MPHPEIEQLSGSSSDGQTKAAISACIANEVRAGKTQDEAIGMCMSMAREKGAPVPQPQQGG